MPIKWTFPLRAGGFAFLAGLFGVVLGAVVIFGWYTENTSLIQINPAFAPMQYNTALGLILGGLGLGFLGLGKTPAARVFGVLGGLWGLVISSQYVFGVNYGIDTLFMDPFVTTMTSHPGRPAPNTAFCFSLIGLAIFAETFRGQKAWAKPAAEISAVAVLAFTSAALLAYLLGPKQDTLGAALRELLQTGEISGWMNITRMAVHTALGFVALSGGFLAFVIFRREQKVATVPLIIPAALVIGALAFDIYQPLGVAAGIAYIPLVFCSLWFRDKNAPYMIAATATLLIILGLFYIPQIGMGFEGVILNRLLAILGVWVTAVVISNLRNTQTKLIESRQDLLNQRELMDAIQGTMIDGLAAIDANGRVLMVNKAVERIFGYSEKEMLGQNIKMLMGGKTRENHDRFIQNYLRTGKGNIIGKGVNEVQGVARDGHKIDLEIVISTNQIGGRQIFVGSLRDITERKRELMQTLSEVEQFAYVASHDLRAPLRAIDNLSQWIEEDLGKALKGEAKENMHLLQARVKRLEKLLDDILHYSRAGRREGKVARVDTHEVAKDMIGLLHIPEGFNVKIQGRLPALKAPEGVFEQIFSNLVANALKHHDRKKGKITLSAREAGRFFEFAVSDDGPGIPEEYRDKVFAMFQKLESRDKTEGSGMGLAIVRKLVRSRGGDIWIEETAAKRGAAFKFTWPKKLPKRKNPLTGKGEEK